MKQSNLNRKRGAGRSKSPKPMTEQSKVKEISNPAKHRGPAADEPAEPFDKKRHLLNRDWLINQLKKELVGPDPQGTRLQIQIPDDSIALDGWGPFVQPDGEEILFRDRPIKRYGTGILFPQGMVEEQGAEDTLPAAPAEDMEQADLNHQKEDAVLESAERIANEKTSLDEDDADDLGTANLTKPSALGISFCADLRECDLDLVVKLSYARYSPREAKIHWRDSKDSARSSETRIWLRRPTTREFRIKSQTLRDAKFEVFESGLKLTVKPRATLPNGSRIYTAVVINEQRASGKFVRDEECAFQVSLQISNSTDSPWLLPYPEPQRRSPSDEEKELALQYRKRKTFGVGHGCAAAWKLAEGALFGTSIWSELVPVHELHPVEFLLRRSNGEPIDLKISMELLSTLTRDDDNAAHVQLRTLLQEFKDWIDSEARRKNHEPDLAEHADAAEKTIVHLRESYCRMQAGLNSLWDDRHALTAFQLANRAMLLAQQRARKRERRRPTSISGSGSNLTINFPRPHEDNQNVGIWRPFQIGFLLQTIRGICQEEAVTADGLRERELVDLIWFPTGGGKTEAYLGLIAFTIFYNRLSGRQAAGCDVIMRYTLRLLTAQQFQRAILLFCAMEVLRAEDNALGEEPFRVGLWVGSKSTPNQQWAADGKGKVYTNTAVGQLRQIKTKIQSSRDEESIENPFMLLECPWCHAHMGPTILDNTRAILGYEERASDSPAESRRVDLCCPDRSCTFNESLPVWIVDSDIYDKPPALLISTIDKFAAVAWEPRVRRLFGIQDDGQVASQNGSLSKFPPSLIVQDELHLISGPLGSVVGMYETLIEELCSYRKNSSKIRPKIVASTATISRASEQILSLFARKETRIFPAPGLDAGQSFFSREALDKPGRMYLGVLATNHGSLQTTQARVYAVLLESVNRMPRLPSSGSSHVPANPAEKDPFWTILSFFNSLRELGNAASLLLADTKEYLRTLDERWPKITRPVPEYRTRLLTAIEELTSRIPDHKIPRLIQQLGSSYPSVDKDSYPLDFCLASNIIEVGIDISRLSLMAVVGQPKTTAQYIQVSSRVGRDESRPGIVVMMYQPSRARDRSHYERFHAYHQALYANVEPTSVTPFSAPVVRRALHAVLVGAVRLCGSSAAAETPRPDDQLSPGILQLQDTLKEWFRTRVETVDPPETERCLLALDLLIKRWLASPPLLYGGYNYMGPATPLIASFGSQALPQWNPPPWITLTSLRNVDKTCEAKVSDLLLGERQER